MSFPSNPSVNDIYNFGNKTYRWDGQSWTKISALSVAASYIGNVAGDIVPLLDETYDIGSPTNKWGNLHLAGNTIYLGNTVLQSSQDGTLTVRSSNAQATQSISLSSNGAISSATGFVGSPRISNIQITDSSFLVLDDSAANTGGYISINGFSFDSGASVVIGSEIANSVSFINDTKLNVALPNLAPGTYTVYVTNSDGATAIRVNGLSISGFPLWISPTGNVDYYIESVAGATQLNATSDGTITHTLYSGSLPTGMSLNANGLITGPATLVNANTTYNFAVNATDSQFQNTLRNFSISIEPNEVYWRTAGGNVSDTYVYIQKNGIITQNLFANTKITDESLFYYANSLPTGLSFNGNIISGQAIEGGNSTSVITAFANGSSKSNTIVVRYEVRSCPLTDVSILLVAGGGSGSTVGGGGGGGGVIQCNNATIPVDATYVVTIGAGGGDRGGNTCLNLSPSLIAHGGGRGGGNPSWGATYAGLSGGSGGGGGDCTIGGASGTPGQGNPGGSTATSPTGVRLRGGGGGAGGAGGNGRGTAPCCAGAGGIGIQTDICGSPTYYAGGGGGASEPYPPACGGLGGGGDAGYNSPGTPGTDFTGGGGGGTNTIFFGGGAGGSGVLIMRYPSSCPPLANLSGNVCYSTDNTYRRYCWFSTGGFSF